jgi:inosose dehydratase
MKISCHLITWNEEYEKGLKEAAELGYNACETFTRIALQFEDRMETFNELLASNGFVLSALYGGGKFGDRANRDELITYNTRVAKMLAACGSDRIVFGPRGPRNPNGTPLEELKVAAETMNEAAKRCSDLGITACVHPHLNTEIQDEREIDAIMELTDPRYVSLCPDTAHLYRAGMDPAVIISRYRDRVKYLHLKDVTPEPTELAQIVITSGTEAMPIFCELGLGPVNFPQIINLLKEIQYDGWLTVEIDSSRTTPKQSLTVCRDYIEQTLGLSVGN